MQFKVPQFIDVEDKLFGPFTFKEFLYLAGGAGIAYLAMKFLPTLLAFIAVPAIIGFSLALTFYKYNDKPFMDLVEHSLTYYTRSRLYLWHKKDAPKDVAPQKTISDRRNEMSANSKLKTLSWSLDVIDPNK